MNLESRFRQKSLFLSYRMHNSRFKIQDSASGVRVSLRGFTLVELLVVVAISFGIAALFLAPFKTLRQRGLLDSSTEQVIGAVESARAFTLAGKSGLPQGIHIDTAKITIFPGTVYVSGSAGNTVITLSSLIVLSNAPSTDMIFQKGTGKPGEQHTLTIALSADATQNRTVTVYATGAIKTQ